MRAIHYLFAILKRHYAAFVLGLLLPAVTGLIAVMGTSEIGRRMDSMYLDGPEYRTVGSIGVAIEDYDAAIEKYDILGFVTGSYVDQTIDEVIELPNGGRWHKVDGYLCAIFDYGMYKLFPFDVISGGGYTGTQNEAVVDVSLRDKYKVGNTYTFKIGSVNEAQFDTTAVVVGYTRKNSYLQLTPDEVNICYADDLKTLSVIKDVVGMYYRLPYGETSNEIAEEHYSSLNSVVGMGQLYALGVFLLLILSLLVIITDMTVNSSMLSRFERVSIRCGMRYRDIAFAYGIKGLLQFLGAFLLIFIIVLTQTNKMDSDFILESLWGGAAAIFILTAVSFLIDFLRLTIRSVNKCTDSNLKV